MKTPKFNIGEDVCSLVAVKAGYVLPFTVKAVLPYGNFFRYQILSDLEDRSYTLSEYNLVSLEEAKNIVRISG